MKNFSAALLAFLQNNRQYNRADLFAITLPNGQILRATSGQIDIVYSGNTYFASKNGAWQRGKITSEASFDLRGNDMTLTVLAPATILYPIAGVSLMAAAQLGLFDAAVVQVFTARWPIGGTAEAGIAAMGVETKYAGFIKPNGTIARSKLEFEVADALYLLNQKMPKHVIQAGCRHTLFDANCTLVATSFMVSTAVASGSTRQSINVATLAQAPPYYTQGYLTLTSGFNAGLSFAVKSQTSTTNLLLANAVPLPLAIGDTFNLFAGCDKTTASCQNKFSNLIHFGGQPFVPNPEVAI